MATHCSCAYMRAYYLKNKGWLREKIVERNRKRIANTPLLRQVYSHNHRARVYGASGRLTVGVLEQRLKSFTGCANCGSFERLEVDHIIPLSRLGDNTPENIQVLCSSCNLKKGVH